MEKLANFDRERIPERVVHARGAAAKGFFEVRTREVGAALAALAAPLDPEAVFGGLPHGGSHQGRLEDSLEGLQRRCCGDLRRRGLWAC